MAAFTDWNFVRLVRSVHEVRLVSYTCGLPGFSALHLVLDAFTGTSLDAEILSTKNF